MGAKETDPRSTVRLVQVQPDFRSFWVEIFMVVIP